MYLHKEFLAEVSIDGYEEAEKAILHRYGSWLKALMLRELTPATDEQVHFLNMCYGKAHPRNDIQKTWKKYQLDVMYKVVTGMEQGIGHNGFTYLNVSNRFRKLGEQGHKGALDWLRREGLGCNFPAVPLPDWTYSTPVDPLGTLINLAEIYPARLAEIDLMNTKLRVPGSFGSSNRQ